jgi:hypothetical protein
LNKLKYPSSEDEIASEISSDVIIASQSIDSILYTISLSGNQAFVSKNGKDVMFEKDLANSQINSGDVFKNSFKEIYFAVVDGMENGVFVRRQRKNVCER